MNADFSNRTPTDAELQSMDRTTAAAALASLKQNPSWREDFTLAPEDFKNRSALLDAHRIHKALIDKAHSPLSESEKSEQTRQRAAAAHTPAEIDWAKKEIERLTTDEIFQRDWREGILATGKKARETWSALHQIAFGTEPVHGFEA